MNNEELKDEIEDLELDIYEQEENLRELKIKRDKLKAEYKCNHIYIKNGYSASEVINNKRETLEIIECTKCGDIAKIKCGRFV